MKNYFEKRSKLIKIQLFSIAKVNKLNETYELLQILNCHKFVWWEGGFQFKVIYVLLPTKVQYTISYLVEKDTTITKHVPTSKAVCCINNYVISAII